jgi:DNA-binding IclR family transcriptional regulator
MMPRRSPAPTAPAATRRMPAIALPGLVDPHDLGADRQFSMNLARGLEVLRAFTSSDPMLGNRDIAERTGLPKATISRITYTLTLLGYLNRDSVLQKYRLGSGVLSLGHPLLASMHVRQIARPIMGELARRTGCTVNLGMRDRDSVVYVDSVTADPGNVYQPDIGSTRPLLAAAIGRALVLARPPAERTAILNRLKVQDRAGWEAHRAALEADQKLFAQHGYTHARGDWRPGVHAVAVPLAGAPRDAPLAMNCTLFDHRLAKDRRDRLAVEVVPLLLDAARRVEAAQGLA